MSIFVNVVNQKMSITSTFDNIVSGTQGFVKFRFNLSEDWDGLMPFAQFAQNGTAYNQYLDDDNCVTLPAEIGAGTCTMMLYGSAGTKRATTNYLTLKIDKNILVEDASSTEITQSLYDQLVAMVEAVTSFSGQGVVDLQNAVAELQAQVNARATVTALTQENIRARAAENENAAAIATKADQSDVDALAAQVANLENNEAIASAIESAVAEELARYLLSGELAEMTIGDGTISRDKVDSEFESTLQKADTAMQPSVYDRQGLGVDVYAYAKGQADMVGGDLDILEQEVVAARGAYGSTPAATLKDSIQRAVGVANDYTRAILSEYEAFTIMVVDSLPAVGQDRTFYLIPKESGTGYDKYWYITNNVGDKQWDVFGASSTLVVSSLPETGDPDVDYILNSANGCLYYKWINNTWKVVAGSLAYVSSTLPSVEAGNEYTDYYIVSPDSAGSYIHYRLINGAYRVIGGDSYTKAQVNAFVSALQSDIDANESGISSNSTNIASLSQTLTNLQQAFNNLDVEGKSYYATYGTATLEATGEEKENVFTLIEVDGDVETVVSQFIIAGGGGGGGQQTSTTLTVERITQSPIVATVTDQINIAFTFSSIDSDGEEVDGSYTWKLGNSVLSTGALTQGVNTFDMTDYCSVGTQKFTLIVSDEGGNSVVKTWTVQKVDVRLESSFNDRVTYNVGNSVNFTYTPYGSVSKVVHFKLDGAALETVTTSASGTLQSYSIPAQTHGAHLLECWMTATVSGTEVETAHIYRDIIWFDASSSIPVIGCIYRCLPVGAEDGFDENTDYYFINSNDEYELYTDGAGGWTTRPQLYYRAVKANQYDTTSMPYYVYSPTTSVPTVVRTIDGESITQTMNTYYDTLSYKTSVPGVHTITLSCGTSPNVASIGIIMDIQEINIDVEPVTANLAFDFNPVGMSNSSQNRLWVDANDSSVAMSVSDNFDWSNGGYQLDEDGNQYFCVKAGTTAAFSYNLFGTSPYQSGAHFKLIFKVTNVRDVDATWLSCVADATPVGLVMKTHAANIISSAATLESPYSEEDMIEFEYDIQTLDTEDANADSLIMTYEDGVAFRPMVYDATHRLYQYAPVGITVGSNDCDVYIYRMKAYTASLTDSNTIANFISDATNSEEMIARYNRNQIYNENNILTPESLALACPDLKIIKIDCPKFTNNKSESIENTTIQCIHTNGDPALDNWTARNCLHSGQGTTSNEYGVAGRNLDLKMNQDNTVITLGDGTVYENGTGKVSLTRTSVPNNYFNVKVNIASSENANNALFANRYDRYLPYTTPAKAKDSRVKTTMEFVNCVVFVRENDPDLSTHREFNDTAWHFYAIGNIGDSKKTDKTRVNDKNDTKEFVNEILDNTLANSVFDTGVYNLIVESLPTTGNLFTDYYVENLDGTYTLKRYVGNSWITANSSVATIQNGAVAIVSSLPATGKVNVEYYVPDGTAYTMYTWDGSAFSDGTAKAAIENAHMANSIDSRQWVAGNAKYDSLYADVFDGDGTNEMRYEHKSTTTAQKLANRQVWRDMYGWVITASDEDFVAHIGDWFIKDALTYYYLYTERYTLMDNRAKNTFWHYSKVYISEEEAAGAYADVADCYTIDNAAAAIRNGYRFDFWDYDNDTGLGINNSGELKMPYGKEDIDYQIDGVPSSGYIFNGAESVIFRRVRLLMHDDLVAMYQNRESAGAWASPSFIAEFDNFQSQFPEELWRLDIERKYYRPYLGTAVDNSIPKDSDRFLKTMLNGRKKFQRRQFERDQAIYMATKYLASSIMADQIMFRCNTPQGAVVTPSYDLTITPYSDMYLSVKFGNTSPVQIRAKAGTEYTVNCPIDTTSMADTAFLIYAASRIQSLNDLSACYIHDNDFSKASKLQTLVIGSTVSGYSNSFLTTLTLGNNALLKTLDVRGCPNLTGSLNLSSCGNLVNLYASGTSLTGVVFATNGKVAVIYLPNTVTSLTMRNLDDITTFSVTLNNLESLIIENGVLDTLDIITDTYDTVQNLRLVGIDWTVPDTTLLNAILAMNSSYLSGSVYISGQVRNQELIRYANAWHDLEVTYVPENLVPQHLITYVNADDENTVLYQTYVDQGSVPPDPYDSGLISEPTLASDVQYTYEFTGWDEITSVVLAPRTVYATYDSTIRTYTVSWYSRPGLLLDSTTANYGSEVVYSGETPTNTSEESTLVFNVFAGWDKSTGFIRGNTDVYAVWNRASLPTAGTDLKDMTPAEVFAVTRYAENTSNNNLTKEQIIEGNVNDGGFGIQKKDYIDITLGHDFNFNNVESHVLTNGKFYDGATVDDTNIKLFGANETSFTIAIDLAFTGTDINNTLLSCFEEDGSEGFRVRYNGGGANIQWGNTHVNVGRKNKKFRDIIVLRHVKGEKKLYVYASNGDSDSFTVPSATYPDGIITEELTRSRTTSTEATLMLGAIQFLGDGTYDDYGTGMVYWCKVWMDDLGDANARKLAAWCHEPLRMEYYGTERYRLAGGTSKKSNASFIANNLLADRGQQMNTDNSNVGGWNSSLMRTFCNSRLKAALPTVWQSMLKKVKINATAGNQSTEILVSEDYVYLASVAEVGGSSSSPYTDEGQAMGWFTSNVLRAKFRGRIIPDDAEHYTSGSDPRTISTNTVEVGDVWQPNGGSNTNYIFVPIADITRFGLTAYGDTDDVGGWVSANTWWLRSPGVGGTTYFWYVGYGGSAGYYYASYSLGVCPCFSI